MSFIDLNINRDNIDSVINKYCNILDFEDRISKKIYTLSIDDNKCIITVFYKDRGLTTLLPEGENKELSTSICQKIYDELKYFDVNALNGSIVVSKEDFNLFIEKIKSKFLGELTSKVVVGGTLYKLEKSREGKLSLSYFDKSNKLLIQGKAGKYFKIIADELLLMDYNVFDLLNGMKELEVPKPADVLQEYFPLIESKLPMKVRSVLSSSLQLFKVNANLADYGLILIPIFRTLEHVMRKILEAGNYEFGDHNSFIMFSVYKNNYHLVLNEQCSLNKECKSKLEVCYTFHSNNRNGLCHMDADEMDITLIESKDMAENIAADCIFHIEGLSDDYQ